MDVANKHDGPQRKLTVAYAHLIIRLSVQDIATLTTEEKENYKKQGIDKVAQLSELKEVPKELVSALPEALNGDLNVLGKVFPHVAEPKIGRIGIADKLELREKDPKDPEQVTTIPANGLVTGSSVYLELQTIDEMSLVFMHELAHVYIDKQIEILKNRDSGFSVAFFTTHGIDEGIGCMLGHANSVSGNSLFLLELSPEKGLEVGRKLLGEYVNKFTTGEAGLLTFAKRLVLEAGSMDSARFEAGATRNILQFEGDKGFALVATSAIYGHVLIGLSLIALSVKGETVNVQSFVMDMIAHPAATMHSLFKELNADTYEVKIAPCLTHLKQVKGVVEG